MFGRESSAPFITTSGASRPVTSAAIVDEYIRHLVLIWAVIDPIGTIPIYLAVAPLGDSRQRRRLAVHAVGIAAVVLLFFIVAGELLLDAMQIPLYAFQIAGGIVLFLFALGMVFGESKPEEEMHLVERGMHSAVFPLAIPSIAGPGAMMAVVLLTDRHRFSTTDQMITTGLVALVLLAQLGILLVAGNLQRLIGAAGVAVISRVMGLLLASLAATKVLTGITDYIGTMTGG